jgi:hypothetical protein
MNMRAQAGSLPAGLQGKTIAILGHRLQGHALGGVGEVADVREQHGVGVGGGGEVVVEDRGRVLGADVD